MASDLEFVEYIRDQIDLPQVTFRKMFGEYALYLEEKVVAFVCDNQLFVKPTAAGRAFLGEPVEAPAYPGSKMYFLIEDLLDDRDALSELIRVTAEELPAPKPKTKAKKAPARKAAKKPAK
jgi:TfoX/Sxy family transcriptional regulator of competence genes